MIKALIFDFDGLIIETEQPDFQSWLEVYDEHGVTLSRDLWLPVIGNGNDGKTFHPYDYLESLVGHKLDRNAIRRKRRARYAALVAAQPLLPGVEKLIATAQHRDLRLAVASSSYREWIAGQLEQRGLLGSFECIACADDVQRTKPAPDVYQAVLANLAIDPAEAITLEDSLNGVRAAKSAGVFCVAVPNPMLRHLDFGEADLVLETLADLDLESLINHLDRKEIAAN